MKAFAFAAASVLASKDKFPSFSWMHAHCEMTVPAGMDCTSAYVQLKQLTDTSSDPASPPGHYDAKESGDNDYVWTVRTTANGQYKDDVIFEFSEDGDNQCYIHARSQSQSLSYLDNNVNFCNMFNIIKQVDSSIAGGQGYKVGQCKAGQSDYTACGRY